MKLNFTHFPKIISERLVLRQLNKADNEKIFLLRSEDRVNKFLERPKQKNIVEADEFISKINNGIKRKEWIYWVISLKENPKLMGTICLWNFSKNNTVAEIGYELLPKFQGLGIMNEALKKIINFGFESIQLVEIVAYTHKDNINSVKLLKKNNFVLNSMRKAPENDNNIIFQLTRKSFLEKN